MKSFILILFIFCFSSAHASLYIEGNTLGSFSNVVTPDNNQIYSISNKDSIKNQGKVAAFNWGNPQYGASNQLTFNGKKWESGLNQAFSLGTMTYRNGSVYNGLIESVDLSINLFGSEPTDFNEFMSYQLPIINTPNTTGNKYSDADYLSILDNNNHVFTLDDLSYNFKVLGFSIDGGKSLFTNFISPEGSIVSADLYGQFSIAGGSEPSPVPVPPTFILLASGLFTLGFIRRKQVFTSFN